jgi:predicted flavoprotein YhiN
VFRDRFAGEPIKRASFSFAGKHVRGEAIIARYGIEGGAIYALGSPIRAALDAKGEAIIAIDLMPDIPLDVVAGRLTTARRDSNANRLRKAGLSPAASGLLREDIRGASLPAAPRELAERIKDLRIRFGGVAAIDRAISTAGGISWDSLNADYSLKCDPRTFIAGEMLDWEAPTGGYLLQACFATGRAAANGILARR